MKTELDMIQKVTDDFELLNDQFAELEKYFYRKDFRAAYNVLQNISSIADNLAAGVAPFTRKGEGDKQ